LKILISNPSIQYTRNTVKALLQNGHDVRFATAYWYRDSNVLIRLIRLLFKDLNKSLQRNSDPLIPNDLVLTKWYGVLFHFFIRFTSYGVEQISYWEDRLQDGWVSNFVKNWKPALIIGYEKSCLHTFEAGKLIGAAIWLDHSQVHPNLIESLRYKFSFFHDITGNTKLFKKITILKKQEYELADTISCLSVFASNTLKDATVAKEKLFVNPIGFDNTIFFPAETVKFTYNAPLQFIYAGIITQRKGIHLLLECFASIAPNLAALTLVGPSGDASPLMNKYLERKNINYIPYLNHQELANEFRKADVFVFPSILDSWAAVVLEAMACGLPVIVTNHTGASQIIADSNGFVIPAGDEEALKNTIKYFIQFPKHIRTMGQNAYKTSLDFSWERYNQALIYRVNKIEEIRNHV
jgi:glycosyltransferase involved in cell wall biosynthesis